MIEKMIKDVDQQRLYKIITDLEGPRHPIDNMTALNEAADYIVAYLTDLGVDVQTQTFKVKGFDEEFRNILGMIGDASKPAIVIGSHYDTVRFSPGANDNLSAVAVSLEVARQLMSLDQPPTVIIACFTLEEGHPGALRYRQELMQEQGLVNDKVKYTSPDVIKATVAMNKRVRKLKAQDYKNNQIYKMILKEDITKEEKQLAGVFDKVYESFDSDTLEETLSLVGSHMYVKKVIKENIAIRSIVNFDCLGWIKVDAGTQKKLPITPDMAPFFNEFKLDLENYVGNFIGIAGDKNSFEHVNKFASCCNGSGMDIPHLAMKLPLEYIGLKKMLPDLLRSDHSPFWQAGIPGIFISDFANFRSELYHTPADQSQHIDYDILKKVVQATLYYLTDEM